MKAFQKLALVAAVSAAPFAQAELKSMDDASLSEMTGQDGVSIIQDSLTTIDSVTYTDADGSPLLGLTNAGYVTISDIAQGGVVDASGNMQAITGLRTDIDVDDLGLSITTYKDDTDLILDGSSTSNLTTTTVGSISVNTGSNLIENLSVVTSNGPAIVRVNSDAHPLGAFAADTITMESFSNITDLNVDVPLVGIGIVGLSMESSDQGDTTSPFAVGATTAAQATEALTRGAGGFQKWIQSNTVISTDTGTNYVSWNGAGWDDLTTSGALKVASTTSKKDIIIGSDTANDGTGLLIGGASIGKLVISGHVSDSTMVIFGH